jgi:hypothetical protein
MSEPARWRTRPALGVAVVAGATLLVGLWLALGGSAPGSAHYALSPQDCTTECQSRQTDCILDCDGKVPCESQCTRVGMACVERCRRPDAGAAGANNSGAAGNAGRRGRR